MADRNEISARKAIAAAVTACAGLTLAALGAAPAAHAAPETCDLANTYPGMNRVDIAMTLVDRGRYRDYATARAVVDHDLTYYCPGIR